jgi:hypothetical protein
MNPIYNVYCDESCHLERDRQPVMVLGAVWCPLEKTREISGHIREIKAQHGLPPGFEFKWGKVSPAKQDFYLALLDYFFDNTDLHFHALVVQDKSKLQHELYEQTHDTWYYKMYFDLLKVIFNPNDCYRVYLDIKDTRSRLKLKKLKDVLCYDKYDFTSQMISRLQNMRSHESQLLQMCDLLLGALSYYHRGLSGNNAKVIVIKSLEEGLGLTLMHSTPLWEKKFNLFLFTPREG